VTSTRRDALARAGGSGGTVRDDAAAPGWWPVEPAPFRKMADGLPGIVRVAAVARRCSWCGGAAGAPLRGPWSCLS